MSAVALVGAQTVKKIVSKMKTHFFGKRNSKGRRGNRRNAALSIERQPVNQWLGLKIGQRRPPLRPDFALHKPAPKGYGSHSSSLSFLPSFLQPFLPLSVRIFLNFRSRLSPFLLRIDRGKKVRGKEGTWIGSKCQEYEVRRSACIMQSLEGRRRGVEALNRVRVNPPRLIPRVWISGCAIRLPVIHSCFPGCVRTAGFRGPRYIR